MSTSKRAELPGVSAGRAAQLVAGALVTEAAMDLFGLSELVLCLGPFARGHSATTGRVGLMSSQGAEPRQGTDEPAPAVSVDVQPVGLTTAEVAEQVACGGDQRRPRPPESKPRKHHP